MYQIHKKKTLAYQTNNANLWTLYMKKYIDMKRTFTMIEKIRAVYLIESYGGQGKSNWKYLD